MQQRVALCRALIYDPPFLLMDEPFGALDALTRDQMNVELMRIWSETKKATLLITPLVAAAVFLADRVLVLIGRPVTILDDLRIDLPRPRHTGMRPEAAFLADRTSDVQGTSVGDRAELGVRRICQKTTHTRTQTQ